MDRTAALANPTVVGGDAWPWCVGSLCVQTPVHAVQCSAHTVSRQRVDVVGLGLLQKLGHVGRRTVSRSRPDSSRSSPKVASISNPGMNATSNHDTRLK